MAGFCVSCGAPMSGAFCNKCGARAVSPGAPAQTAQPAPPAPQAPVAAQAPAQAQGGWQSVSVPTSPPVNQPISAPTYQPVNAPITAAAPKSSGVGKILLWVGGILLVLFVLGASAAVYGAYWVKHKVTNFATQVTKMSGDSSDSMKVVASGNSCRLLSTSELQQVLGVPIEKSAEIVEDSQPGCAYFTNQDAFSQLQKQALAQTKRQTEEANARPGPKPDNLPALMKNANDLEGAMKALTMTQPSADGRVFYFTVEHSFGADSWSGMRLTESAVPGFQEVSGVGDHAMIGAFGHAFYVQKGDTLITMSMMWVPEARLRGSALGKKILGNL